jgi:hypothetical protein
LSAKKKDKKRSENSEPEIIIIQRQIIFDEDFREDLQWWYRQDVHKANKILDRALKFSHSGEPITISDR